MFIRVQMVLIAYWILFVLLPTFLIGWYFELSGAGIIGVLVILAIIGERGFRVWKKIWKRNI